MGGGSRNEAVIAFIEGGQDPVARLQEGDQIDHLLYGHHVVHAGHRRVLHLFPFRAGDFVRDSGLGMDDGREQVAVGAEAGDLAAEHQLVGRSGRGGGQVDPGDGVAGVAAEGDEGRLPAGGVAVGHLEAAEGFLAGAAGDEAGYEEAGEEGSAFHDGRGAVRAGLPGTGEGRNIAPEGPVCRAFLASYWA